MATITAVKSGNWSDTTVWDLGRAPADGDLALAASYTITFDVDVNQPNTVLNATSGNFRHSGAGTRNVTANANVGNHTVGGLIQNTSTGTLNFYGAIVGGSGNFAYGASNAATGTITITTCTGGSGSWAYGASNAATGTITITTATGGSGSSAYGAYNAAAGTLHITTATGGSGSSAHGAFNNATGTLRVQLAVGNDYGPGGTHANATHGVGANNSAGQITSVQSIRYGPHGQSPTAGPVQIVADAALNQATFVTDYSGGTLTLLDATASADWPAVANVRSGVSYDNGNKTGTCAVPTAAQTAYGVPVDATTGTAVLTAAGVTAGVWDAARSGHAGAGTFGATSEWAGSVDENAIATAAAAAILAAADSDPISANVTMQAGVLIPGPLALEATSQAILEDTGTTLPAAIAAASAAGSGAISFPVTINDEDSNPIDGVEVWISTDSAGTSVVAGTLSTDALGLATFMLDAGTYYLWRQKSGYNFTNPVTIVVS